MNSARYGSVRGDARQPVAEKWANRRKQQQSPRLNNNNNNNTSLPPTCTIPPLCVLLCRSWNEAIKPFQQQVSSPPPSTTNLTTSTSTSATTTTTTTTSSTAGVRSTKQPNNKNKNKRSSFPSVVNILQANALKAQVESFFLDDQDILSVLPADYDFQQAIVDMSRSRSRVFLLLDLAAIVQTHVHWRKRLPPKTVQLVYSTKHNANPKLLQVLARLGVGLQVATTYDLQVCRHEIMSTTSTSTTSTSTSTSSAMSKVQLYDDPSNLSKPNSFYRQLILDTSNHADDNDNDNIRPPLAVDGPQEVERIISALRTMAQRRKQPLPELTFLLRLNVAEDYDQWERNFQETYQTAKEQQQQQSHRLVGISLELPAGSSLLEMEHCLEHLTRLLQYAQDTLDVTLQLDLCNPSSEVEPQVLDWLGEYAGTSLCSSVTLDVSHLLVANAGALCTRIIGVKQNEVGKIHYYIDDGCYGSLSNVAQAVQPLPLQANRGDNNNNNNTDDNGNGNDNDNDEQLVATVWGPTCDGLDKVCADILLPKLSRDDWLVFANLGFCHVGTCFNGFEPPDIAYCVLGGYLHPSQKN